MNTYYIRYNTKHGDTDLVWRVFENGVEHLVRGIEIDTKVYGAQTWEHGASKWNMACHGVMNIVDGVAYIK